MSDSRCRGRTRRGSGGGRESGRRRLGPTAAVVVGLVAAMPWARASRRARSRMHRGPGEAPAARPAEPAAVSAEALSLRYRFTEKIRHRPRVRRPTRKRSWSVPGRLDRDDPERDGESPGRARTGRSSSYQTIYTERPAKVGRLGEVTDAVRRYDSFRAGDGPQGRCRQMAGLLRDLNLWYHLRPADPAGADLPDAGPADPPGGIRIRR